MPRKSTNTTDTGSSSDDIEALRAEMERLKGENSRLASENDGLTKTAREARLNSMSAEERALESQIEANASTISSLEGEVQFCEDEIARIADEPGHGKEIGTLNRRMATAVARLEVETRTKDYLAGQREALTSRNTQSRQQEERGGTAADRGRKLPNGSHYNDFPAATRAWFDRNPEIMDDGRLFARAVAAAIEATGAEGLRDQSPEYFAFIEKRLGGQQMAQQDDEDEEGDEEGEDMTDNQRRADNGQQGQQRESYEPERPQHRAAGSGSMAAPVNRALSQTPNNGGNRRKPSLTAEEKEVADALYASIKNPADRYVRYAENKRVMESREPGHFVRH